MEKKIVKNERAWLSFVARGGHAKSLEEEWECKKGGMVMLCSMQWSRQIST